MNVCASHQGSLLHLGCCFSTSATSCFPSLLQGALRESRQWHRRTEVRATAIDDVRIAFGRRGNLRRRMPPALAGGEVGEVDDSSDSSPSGGGPVSTAISQPKTPPRKGSGVGFGAAQSSTKTTSLKASKDKGPKEKTKAAVIRRAPPEKPAASPQDPQIQQIETAFIASWAFLGALILVEGVVLAASGFLPEDWDDFLVKFLYPSFSPTVGLFLIGTAGYGLYKYLGGGNKTN